MSTISGSCNANANQAVAANAGEIQGNLGPKERDALTKYEGAKRFNAKELDGPVFGVPVETSSEGTLYKLFTGNHGHAMREAWFVPTGTNIEDGQSGTPSFDGSLIDRIGSEFKNKLTDALTKACEDHSSK